MSPEEFDNRLRASFKDEYLPPREQLWQNVSSRLESAPGASMWRWAAPVVVTVVVGLTWLGVSLFNKNKNSEKVSTNEIKTEILSVQENDELKNSNIANAPAMNPKSKNEFENNSATAENQTHSETNLSAETNLNSRNNTSNKTNFNNKKTNLSNNFNGKNKKFSDKKNKNNPFAGVTNLEEMNIFDLEKFSSLSLVAARPFAFHNATEDIAKSELIQRPIIHKTSKAERKIEAIKNSGDFSNVKWFVNFSVGQLMSINKAGDINKDSSEYFHKDLYKNIGKMSGNGGGFQIQSTVTRRFGKDNRFNIEVGLQYSQRRENIGLNESTINIKVTDQNGKIKNYLNSTGYFIVGPKDTQKFVLTESFAYIKRNTYSVYSLPIRFNAEQQITPNTFISLGLGGGLSYIRGVNTGHYNLSQQKEMTVTESKFTGSMNTMLQVYTNYNATVQLGVYTGYQMYFGKYDIANQYKLKMSDLQFGLTCKVPLDYH